MRRSLILFSCLAPSVLAAPARAEVYRLGLITPPPYQWTSTDRSTDRSIAEDLDRATDGHVEILLMPSGQLGNEARMLQQLQTGAMDFAMMTAAECANRSDNYGIFYAPYPAQDTQQAARLLRGDVASDLLEGTQDFGLHGLAWGMAGMRQVVSAGAVSDVADVADLDGLRVRTVPLAPEMDFWTALGAAPTSLPLPALYDAFAKGQVDAMQIDHEGTWNCGHCLNAGTVVTSRHMIFPMAAVASSRKWAAIDAAIAANQAQLKAEGVPVIEVGRDWFGGAVDDWYAAWRKRTPLPERLEAEAA